MFGCAVPVGASAKLSCLGIHGWKPMYAGHPAPCNGKRAIAPATKQRNPASSLFTLAGLAPTCFSPLRDRSMAGSSPRDVEQPPAGIVSITVLSIKPMKLGKIFPLALVERPGLGPKFHRHGIYGLFGAPLAGSRSGAPAAASSSCRSRSDDAELTRQLGDRPVAPTAATTPSLQSPRCASSVSASSPAPALSRFLGARDRISGAAGRRTKLSPGPRGFLPGRLSDAGPQRAPIACAQPLHFTPMLKLGWPVTFRIPLRLLTVGEVALVDKAWVHGFAIGREGFDEMSRQPGYGCGELVS
jgi:hypothetical protein